MNPAYLLGVSVLVGACAPHFDIIDDSGAPMFQVQRSGVCFIGCNLRLERADGVICSGYAVGIEAGAGLSALIRCPKDPVPGTRCLVTTPLGSDAPAIGVLGALESTDQRNREAIEKALAYADQLSKTN